MLWRQLKSWPYSTCHVRTTRFLKSFVPYSLATFHWLFNFILFYFLCNCVMRRDLRVFYVCMRCFNAVESSSSSSPSSRSPLASSLTRSVFHSELKTWLFGKSFPPQTFSFPTGLIPRLIDWVRLIVPPTHYRSYGTGFYGSNDPTNSVKALN